MASFLHYHLKSSISSLSCKARSFSRLTLFSYTSVSLCQTAPVPGSPPPPHLMKTLARAKVLISNPRSWVTSMSFWMTTQHSALPVVTIFIPVTHRATQNCSLEPMLFPPAILVQLSSASSLPSSSAELCLTLQITTQLELPRRNFPWAFLSQLGAPTAVSQSPCYPHLSFEALLAVGLYAPVISDMCFSLWTVTSRKGGHTLAHNCTPSSSCHASSCSSCEYLLNERMQILGIFRSSGRELVED